MKRCGFLFSMILILAGNIPANFVSAAKTNNILINEIAWMGTETSYNNEWVELYNNTDSPIDLNGWILKAIDGSPKINLAGNIPAEGFYLLERSKNYTGALENSGEFLELYDNLGDLIDSVNADSGWPAGDNETKQTMEKTASGWQSSQSPGGTPAAENSSPLIQKVAEKVAETQRPLKSPIDEAITQQGPQEPGAAQTALTISRSSSKSLASLVIIPISILSGVAVLILKKKASC